MGFLAAVPALAEISTAATVAGALISAGSASRASEAQQANANYQAAVAQNNQTLANQYAQAETQKGQVEEAAKRQETAQREGAIRASLGASGLDMTTGTPLRLQEDTARLGEVDALTIRNNAARAAYGYQVQGMNAGAQSQLYSAQASQAATSGELGAWSSLIGGASSVGDKWAKFKTAGVYS